MEAVEHVVETASSPETADTYLPEENAVSPLLETAVQPLENPVNPPDYVSRFASDFQKEACLGRGGFGVVFKAINRLDDCVYAVKRIELHDSESEKVMREVKALARLDHPGIVRYYHSWLERPPPGWQEAKDRVDDLTGDFTNSSESSAGFYGKTEKHSSKSTINDGNADDDSIEIIFRDGDWSNNKENNEEEYSDGSGCGASTASKTQKLYLYIQMQLCQMESLKDWLSSNTEDRDKNRLLNIFHQIVLAVSYIHREGLMHRDLTPSNIFFALDGMVKIGDFGLVTAAEESYTSNAALATKHTNQVGTALYMSPEQSSGGSYTYKVDIYALGMIFFELFVPFQTQMERIQTLTDIRQLRFPPRFVDSFSREYEFVRPLLSHDPDSRPSTQEILRDTMLVELVEEAEWLKRSRNLWRLSSQAPTPPDPRLPS